jgi:hypothetical protein
MIFQSCNFSIFCHQAALCVGVWQGVAMDSQKFYPVPLCPTLLQPVGGPSWIGRLRGFSSVGGLQLFSTPLDTPHRTPMSATIGLLSKVMLMPPSLIYHSSGWEFGITKYQIFMEVGTLFLHLISGGHVARRSMMVTHKLWLCSIGER